MPDKLTEALECVADEATFLEFVGLLGLDWIESQEKEKANPSSPYGPNANGWENSKLGEFLVTAADWGNLSTNGLPMYEAPSNPWRRMADILSAAKIYE